MLHACIRIPSTMARVVYIHILSKILASVKILEINIAVHMSFHVVGTASKIDILMQLPPLLTENILL